MEALPNGSVLRWKVVKVMNEQNLRFVEMHGQNNEDKIKISGMGRSAQNKVSLRHIRKVQRIKAVGIGQCYDALGDVVWQMLCDIYLNNLEEADLSISDLAWSVGVSEPLARRYVAVLQAELFVESDKFGSATNLQNLKVTEYGQSKIEEILIDCKKAFTEIFIYSQPEMAAPSP